MKQEINKSKRGGKREGSGRPFTGRINPVAIRISDEAKKVLDNQQNKNEFIDRIIVEWAKKHK